MYYPPFTPAQQEFGRAVAEPECEVYPTAEVLHHITAHGGDHFRTQDSVNVFEEAEHSINAGGTWNKNVKPAVTINAWHLSGLISHGRTNVVLHGNRRQCVVSRTDTLSMRRY